MERGNKFKYYVSNFFVLNFIPCFFLLFWIYLFIIDGFLGSLDINDIFEIEHNLLWVAGDSTIHSDDKTAYNCGSRDQDFSI